MEQWYYLTLLLKQLIWKKKSEIQDKCLIDLTK